MALGLPHYRWRASIRNASPFIVWMRIILLEGTAIANSCECTARPVACYIGHNMVNMGEPPLFSLANPRVSCWAETSTCSWFSSINILLNLLQSHQTWRIILIQMDFPNGGEYNKSRLQQISDSWCSNHHVGVSQNGDPHVTMGCNIKIIYFGCFLGTVKPVFKNLLQ